MQLNRMEDLIPHKESLKALYQSEEFQILLSFLSSLRGQKENEVWAYQGSVNGKDAVVAKTELAVMISQRNLITMLENLPQAIQMLEDTIEKQKQQAQTFAKSQE